MPTLTHDTFATQIHGTTAKEIASCTLDKGAAYQIVRRYTDGLGCHWALITVGGYLYEVESVAVDTSAPEHKNAV